MRVLILGGYGMLGHKMFQVLSEHFDVFATVRNKVYDPSLESIFERGRVIDGVDALDQHNLRAIIEDTKPDAVVNCIGIIKQLREAHDPVSSIATNSLLPHQLSSICRDNSTRLIHISTDCVFSGNRGAYTELDSPDPIDLYGRTKWLGEVIDQPHALTIRTSIIGRELSSTSALVEWFLSQSGETVRGFSNAIFSGLPTITLSRVVAKILVNQPDLHGLFHVSAEPVNKFDLLQLVKESYGLETVIEPYPDPAIDRSLNSDKFRRAAGWTPSTWPELITEMATDPTPYESLRKQ